MFDRDDIQDGKNVCNNNKDGNGASQTSSLFNGLCLMRFI